MISSVKDVSDIDNRDIWVTLVSRLLSLSKLVDSVVVWLLVSVSGDLVSGDLGWGALPESLVCSDGTEGRVLWRVLPTLVTNVVDSNTGKVEKWLASVPFSRCLGGG